jgi:hypothetical protein
MLPLAVLPQTCAVGSLLDVQGVPVAASVKQGVSGEGPQQLGLMRQALLLVGRLMASSIDVEPPVPLQTTCWQVPGFCRLPGAVELPGYAHVPLVLQSDAAQAGTVELQVWVQQ